MKVLIACEESQEVCKAFMERGHEAYSCDIQECSGGHPYSKKTCLWLKGLPELTPTNVVSPICSWVAKFRDSRTRSKTFPGIAKAMAEQWG